jgi:hypothetical protein
LPLPRDRAFWPVDTDTRSIRGPAIYPALVGHWQTSPKANEHEGSQHRATSDTARAAHACDRQVAARDSARQSKLWPTTWQHSRRAAANPIRSMNSANDFACQERRVRPERNEDRHQSADHARGGEQVVGKPQRLTATGHTIVGHLARRSRWRSTIRSISPLRWTGGFFWRA